MFEKAYALILCVFNVQEVQRCSLNSRIHFRNNVPIIIRNGRLLEPTDSYGNVVLERGDQLTLSCEGSGTIYHPNKIRDVITETITCLGGDNFEGVSWITSPSRFSEFACLDPPIYMSRRTNRLCYNGNKIFEVGYSVGNEFYPSYESCFNEIERKVLYSTYTQKPYNAFYQTRVPRPRFKADENFGNIPVDYLFSPKGLREAIALIVGNTVDQYVTSTESLSRGHLAARTDFMFAFTEQATFHYVNCAPQWTGLNGGNWNTLEIHLREHIHNAGYNTVIYTGTYGVTQLMDRYGQKHDIYLTKDENNNPLIPVPEYFYKVVYEPTTKRGIAFIGINNPYYTLEQAMISFFCRDLCRHNNNFSWLPWNPDNPREGYTFCCTVDDFRLTVPHLPQFEVTGILT